MGNKRNLHRMSKASQKAMRGKANFKKRQDTKKRVAKLTYKRTVEEDIDEEEKDIKLRTIKIIEEENYIKTLTEDGWEKVKQLPYVISIPPTFGEFSSKIDTLSSDEILIYIKRMREYDSYLADYSKKQKNIDLFGYILKKFDESVKDLDFKTKEDGLKLVDAYYKNIYEMASYLPSVYLDYIRNKLSAYTALLKKLEEDIEKET